MHKVEVTIFKICLKIDIDKQEVIRLLASNNGRNIPRERNRERSCAAECSHLHSQAGGNQVWWSHRMAAWVKVDDLSSKEWEPSSEKRASTISANACLKKRQSAQLLCAYFLHLSFPLFKSVPQWPGPLAFSLVMYDTASQRTRSRRSLWEWHAYPALKSPAYRTVSPSRSNRKILSPSLTPF